MFSATDGIQHALFCHLLQTVPDLAPMLWHSGGTIAALLYEIVSIYGLIHPPTLTATDSNRVCNSRALLQCVASHPETRSPFLAVSPPRRTRLRWAGETIDETAETVRP